MKKEEINLENLFLEEICEFTGFEKTKIELVLSRRKNEKSSSIDYHEFKHEDKEYIFSNNKLEEKK